MNTSLTSLDKSDLLRKISRQEERISKLEALLQGQAIGGVKIDSIAWDKAQGGTAVLGGLNNVDGKAEIRDALNNLVVLLDKTGISINNGKLSIQNDSNVVTMDAKGIRSTTNFVQTGTTNQSLSQSFTSTSEVDVTGSSGNIVLDRSRLAVFLIKTQAYLVESVGNTADAEIGLSIDGNLTNWETRQRFNVGNDQLDTRMSFFITSLAAGTHPVKLTGKLLTIYAGSPSLVLFAYTWSYLLLGT